MSKPVTVQFEQVLYFLTDHFPPSNETSKKPRLFHSIRVGTFLYENSYRDDIVIAGLLHDTLEWSRASKEMLRKKFGNTIVQLILANTKNDTITDSDAKIEELIKCCARWGQDALIIKTADILDSFHWYERQENTDELRYCMKTAHAIMKYKPDDYDDKIFDELKEWQEKYIHLLEDIYAPSLRGGAE